MRPIISRELLSESFTGAGLLRYARVSFIRSAKRRYYGFYEKHIFSDRFFSHFLFSRELRIIYIQRDGFFLSSNSPNTVMFIMSAVAIIQLSIIYSAVLLPLLVLSLPELMRVLIVSVITFPADYIRKFLRGS